jgi:phage shock protein A
MGLFARLARLIKSNINALISSSEEPEKMLNQLIIDMKEQLEVAKKQVAVAIADEKRLMRQVEIASQQAAEWEKKAMLAVRASDDALAKEALSRKKEHETTALQYREQWNKQKAGVEQLKLALRALNNKIEEARRKKDLLIARKRRAEAQKAIHETMSGLKNASAFEAFDQMASRIEQMEAEADAQAEIAEEYTGDVMAHKFRELEVTAGADEDLLALKRKMGLVAPEPSPKPARVGVSTSAGAERSASEEFGELDALEQEELAKALAELEASEQQNVQVKS